MNSIIFRKVKSPEALRNIVDFLVLDVKLNGGSASETVDLHGKLWDIQVTSSPWGPIVIKAEVNRLEALSFLFGAAEE